uniref:ATP receptor n=1 Tax=Macrostomum lignano TaxID=282301 RepID=A0A1I8FQ10_9PLAT
TSSLLGAEKCLAGSLAAASLGSWSTPTTPISRPSAIASGNVADWAVPAPDEQRLLVTTNVVITKNQSQTTCEEDNFGVKRRNILTKMTNRYLKTCNYRSEPPEDRYCPIFKLGDIIKYGQAISEKAAKQIWITGGMVAIDIHWECNFDYDEEHCKPEYKFRNLEDGKVGQGWNFRHAYHYVEDGNSQAHPGEGLRHPVLYQRHAGRGGKFDILNFTMNLGSGLALLTLATVLCDIISCSTLCGREKKYRQAKIDKVWKRKVGSSAPRPSEKATGGGPGAAASANRLGGATESGARSLGSGQLHRPPHARPTGDRSPCPAPTSQRHLEACGAAAERPATMRIRFPDARNIRRRVRRHCCVGLAPAPGRPPPLGAVRALGDRHQSVLRAPEYASGLPSASRDSASTGGRPTRSDSASESICDRTTRK